jgi:methionyl-tRNA formyltransferase
MSNVVGVATQPDRKAGRGQKMKAPPVKAWAVKHNLPVLQPAKMKDPEFIRTLAALKPDLLVVVAYRMLPKEVLDVPTWGAINLHGSLLPKYRGAAPIQWSIVKGEIVSGVTIFKIDEQMDHGNIIIQKSIAIDPADRASELHDKLMIIGAGLLAEAVKEIAAGTEELKQQDASLACPAPKLKKDDGKIDWTLSAHEIRNCVRGFYPYPMAFTFFGDDKRRLCITRAKVLPDNRGMIPGTIISVAAGIDVAAGDGTLRIMEVKPECKREMSAEEFARGCDWVKIGKVLS